MSHDNKNASNLLYKRKYECIATEGIEVLADRREDGKVRDWSGKKKRSLLMADHFMAADLDKKAERMGSCADVLRFKQNGERLRLYQTWFCKVRLCPMCNWRRSLKIAWQNKRIIETANQREKLRWLFLTLTVKNCEPEELKLTISDMTKAFNRLFKYKRVAQNVRGYFRALEVTKNTDPNSLNFGTYHPHFHVLLAVKSTYFKNKANYITQEEWTKLWQKAGKLSYSPIVHVTAVKPSRRPVDAENVAREVGDAISDSKAVFEVSKYPLKDTDVIKGDSVTDEGVESVLVLDHALARRRLIGYGGLLKEIHAELKLDSEDGDLVHVDEDSADEVAKGAFEVMAYWHIGLKQYVVKEGGKA